MSNYRLIALTASSAIFMQFLDATALTTALPSIARDMHVPATDLNVAILSYQLSMAALIPAGSALGDRIGPRRAFVAALAMFMIGSILCALSHSLVALTVSRAVQGLGGAVMMPISRLLVVRSADRDQLVSALNWLLIPGIVGPLLGPGFGGLIVSIASWHWIFLVNVPIGLIGIALTLIVVPHVETTPGRFDLKGLAILGPAIVLLTFGLEGLSRPGGVLHAIGMLLLGLGLFLLYVRHAARVAQPAIDLSLLAIASFRHSAISGTLQRMAIGALGFVLPLWFQLGMAMTPAKAGSIMMLSAAGALLSRFASTPLLIRAAPLTVALWGMAGYLAIVLAFLALGPGTPDMVVYGAVLLMGFLSSVALTIVSAAAYVEIPPERTGPAAGFYVLLQQLSMSLGVTAGVWAIAVSRWAGHTTLHDNRTYAGAAGAIALLIIGSFIAAVRFDEKVVATLKPRQREAA